MEQELLQHVEGLGFQLHQLAANPQLTRGLIELALSEPPDATRAMEILPLALIEKHELTFL